MFLRRAITMQAVISQALHFKIGHNLVAPRVFGMDVRALEATMRIYFQVVPENGEE